MTTVFEFEVREEGFEYSLSRSGKRIAVSRWVDEAPERLLPGISQVIALVDDQRATVRSDVVLVPHAIIAGLGKGAAASIGISAPSPYLLDIQHTGTIDQESFRLRAAWLQANGQQVHGLRRTGAALVQGTRRYRVVEPLFSLVVAIDEFNAADIANSDARFKAWAEVRGLLTDDATHAVRLDDYLSSTRVAFATRFSLNLRSGADGFTFDPILFGPSGLAESPDFGPISERDVDALLPPHQQSYFSEQRFKREAECKSKYALTQGWYVVLDEPVRRALNIVKRAQTASAEVRREFARNPRGYLRKALESELREEEIESLFVETAEYSERIQDVGVWQPRVLPWVQTTNEPWLPETFGIDVGGQSIEVNGADAAKLQQQITAAIEAGKPTITWNGLEIPATEDVRRAVGAMLPPAKPQSGGGSAAPAGPKSASNPRQQYVLDIVDNLSALGFQRWRVVRKELLEIAPPVGLQTALKPHQDEGLRWLQQSWASGQTGVLLADDMGLGKTMQALAFLSWLRQAMLTKQIERRPILIVAPTGLLQNWKNEHGLHLRAPGLGDATEAHGRGLAALRESKGREVETGVPSLKQERLSRSDWILTTYETMRDYQHSFCAIRYAAVVFDEMQKVKTPGTVMTHAAKALHTDFVLGLTGTPVENRLADLWCLVDTMQPGLLKDLASFSKSYERNVEPDDLKKLKSALTGPTDTVPPVMMRRMKADSLKGLPKKTEHPLEAPMPTAQAAAYETAVSDARASHEPGKMLEALHRLRSISLHPFGPEAAQGDAYIAASARFQLAVKVLDQIKVSEEKVLIFLESQEMQPFVASLIQRRYRLDAMPMLINGTVAGKVRQARVDAFQSSQRGFDAMILSPRAGGVGLTLTAANHVIHLSRWWNPAIEDQCTDRVFRIGQKRDVHVYYLQAIHPKYGVQSFDRRLHDLLERKRRLSRDLLMPSMSPKDTEDLFRDTVGASGDQTTVRDLDAMEPIQFENWVMTRLRNAGHETRRTQRTHDGGADCIAHHRLTGRPMIVQCKHTQGGTSPDTAIDDLERASAAYQLKNPLLVALSNAEKFGKQAKERGEAMGVTFVKRNDLANWPEGVGWG